MLPYCCFLGLGNAYVVFLQLVSKYDIDKKLLPPKKAFGNTLDSFIQKRRGGLERYLQALLRQFEMIPFQLAMFLDFQKYVSVLNFTMQKST